MTGPEQEAINQIKEVIMTTLEKFPVEMSRCSIRVQWEEFETSAEGFVVRPNVTIEIAK